MSLIRRLRAPLIGLVVLVFSAGIALGAAPTSPGAAGLANAANHAGKTVPVADGQDETVTETESTTETESSTESESSTTSDSTASSSADHCNVDLTQDPSVLAGLNHGSVVCSAAHQAPPAGYSPDGFANHGDWVSHWAKSNHGSNQSATVRNHKGS